MPHKQELPEIICPLCGSNSNKALYQVQARDTAGHMFQHAGSHEQVAQLESIIEDLWGKADAAMYSCKECSLVFADPFIAGTAEFYSAVYRQDNYYPDWKWDYEVTFNDLEKLIPSGEEYNGTLLEIGAGNGAFVKKLAGEWFSSRNLQCTEYSEFGAEKIQSLGINCISGPVSGLESPENKARYDFICMFQVLEHLDGIENFFHSLNYLAHQGTVLYITVPGEEYRAFFDRLGKHLDTPPNHLTRWNKRSFGELGEKFGWELKRHEVQSMPFSEKLKRLIFDRLEFHGIFRAANWQGKKLPLLRKMGLAIVAGFMILAYAGSIIKLRKKQLGVSQWVKLIKE